MYKLAVLFALVAAASAGLLSAPEVSYASPYAYGGYASPYSHGGYASPYAYGAGYGLSAHGAHIAHTPVATSYANTYKTVNNPIAVAAPIAAVAHAPAISYAAPAVATVAHAPALSYAHSPAISYAAPAYGGLYKSSLGYGGLGYGYSGLYHH